MHSKPIFLILCGGKGSRLRELTGNTPKQFFTLKSGKTLLEITASRLQKTPLKIGLVLNSQQIPTAKKLLLTTPDYWIAEPFSKNTAPAIAFATQQLLQTHRPETVVIFAPCDQVIFGKQEFLSSIEKASSLASSGKIVLIGFAPEQPDPSLGYFLPQPNTDYIKKFVEKPDQQTATTFLNQGYLANSGIFVGTLQAFTDTFNMHSPELMQQLKIGDFEKITAISFDHAILQKSVDTKFVNTACKIVDVGKVETFLKFEKHL